jgi:hypothetical protein
MIAEFKIPDFGVRIPHSSFRIPHLDAPPVLTCGPFYSRPPSRPASDPSAITQAETRTVVRVSCRKEKG